MGGSDLPWRGSEPAWTEAASRLGGLATCLGGDGEQSWREAGSMLEGAAPRSLEAATA